MTLSVGDEFYIHVLDETLAYRVCEINVVEPSELEKLQAEEGRDLVTLVTCTPYGVNSHRLLVKGERTEYNPEKVIRTESKTGFYTKYKYYIIGIAISFPILILIGVLTYLYSKKRARKAEKNEQGREVKKE